MDAEAKINKPHHDIPQSAQKLMLLGIAHVTVFEEMLEVFEIDLNDAWADGLRSGPVAKGQTQSGFRLVIVRFHSSLLPTSCPG